ncbi:TolC family protein [Parabacteroides sp. AM08-6]|uniref:TolC family protein n=1 Tax=Parabacteroides sp. AM08-6 TaxID=2292053 RepID=UPI000EFE0E93|nr:TolC family protein [Parabacteroides sp. AM08-6]RHJ86755.1 TolC family protein [Parabacteroides sp. AM08-6]
MKRKKYQSILFLSLLCAWLAPVSAQHTYTLDECVREALSNNVRMKNAVNNIGMAEQGKKEAFTKYFPSLSATGGGFIANKGLVQMEMAPGQNMSMLKDGIVGGVSAALPLFTGGQIINGNKLARVDVEVNRLQQKLSENEVRLTTEQYFWQVVMLKEKLNTISKVEQQLAQILNDVENSVSAGLTTRNDLLQVQLRCNETKSGRIQIENNLSLLRSMLAQYIGHPADSVDVEFTTSDTLPDGPDMLYREPQKSLILTDEYRLLEQQVKANNLQYKMSIGKNLPTIALGGGYMYDNLMGKNQSFWMGFATVSVPLSGWWGGSHDIKRQKLQVRNAENQKIDQSQMLVIRMQHTWNDLNDAYKQIQIARLSIEQANENLRLNTDYYTAGTCTMSDLLEAQTLYQQSCDKYVEVYTQYEIKKREYLQATGR